MQIDKYKLFSRTFFTLFWVMMCWGFVSQELLPFLNKLSAAELLVVDVLFLLLGVATLRNKGDILVLAVFMVLGIISNIIVNKIGFVNLFNGTRDFLGIIFGVPVIRWFMTSRHREGFIATMDKNLRIFLFVQAFCLVWQFIKYGANDAGGGSFGYGSSGMVSTLIYLISYYLLSKSWDVDNLYTSLKKNRQYLLLLLPTFLNETKISFIYMLIYFLLLLKYDKAMIARAFLLIPLFIGAVSLMFMVYLDATGASEEDEADMLTWEFFMNYLVNGEEDLDHQIDMALRYQDGEFDDDLSVDWWVIDMPRYAKVILIVPVMMEQKGGLWFGAGVGTLKGSRTMTPTKFARDYQWLLFGTRIWPLSLFVTLGIPGILWWLWAFGRIAIGGKILQPNGKRVYLLLMSQMTLIFLYSDFIRTVFPMLVFIYLLFVLRTPPVEQEKSLPAN